MSEEKREYLKLEEIVNAEAVEEVLLPIIGKYVKIKNASTRDRVEAEKLASRHPNWINMGPNEKAVEIGKMLALTILVEPKISYEDYTKSNDLAMQLILNAVSNIYSDKLARLAEKQGYNVKSFLEQWTEEQAKSSSNSSS